MLRLTRDSRGIRHKVNALAGNFGDIQPNAKRIIANDVKILAIYMVSIA